MNLRKVSLPTAFTKIRSRIATRITSHWSCRLLHTPSVKALPAGDFFPMLQLIREQLGTFLPLNALRSSP